MRLIVPFSVSELPPLNQVGGKALSLIAMTQEGLPVPSGFVLTVPFFEPWIAALSGTPEWAALQSAEGEALQRAARALQTAALALEMSPEQAKSLREALSDLQDAAPDCLFAVRSSSPEEDLEGASFAGGYVSTLGVTSEDIEKAIRQSFASIFDSRVILYKRAHGLVDNRPRIAIIVQQQIAAESAGVAFSLNPVNNCYDEAVIDANYGLGESVVSGEVSPDVFVVDKIQRQIKDTQVGNKQFTIALNTKGGTIRTARPTDQQTSITPAQVLALSDLVVQVEKAQQNQPVDIEWAIADGNIYLLQARPITTYLPLPEEMVTPPGIQKYLYADSTLIEQGLEKPLSVLGIDFVRYVLKVMAASLGGDVGGVDGATFTAGGRYYMNLSHTIKLMGRDASLAPGSAGDEGVMAILDSIDLDQYLPEKLPPALAANKRKMPLMMLRLMIPIMKAVMRPESVVRNYKKNLPEQLRRFESVMDDDLSMKQQAIDLTALLKFFFVDYGIPMVMGAQMAQNRMAKIFEGGSDEVNAHLLGLGIALPGNKTAEMGAAMVKLASSAEIQEASSSEAFVQALEQRALDPGFLQAWDDFMTEYGARCPQEIDVATPRPNERPELLFTQLQDMALTIDSDEGAGKMFQAALKKRDAAYQALKDLALRQGGRKAKAFEKNYHTWVTLGGYRETGKHYVIKCVDMYRKRALQVGRDFVADGRLNRPEQIFDLTIDDIDQGLENPAMDLRERAQERSAPINRIKRSHLTARVIDSRGKIFYPPRQSGAEGELLGVAISPGLVRGKVKVLHNADEKKLLPGEILVTRVTDPGWTPLFINAGGVILEIGGTLQHGAVVAREYGLPCVSSLDGATELLKDGQIVEVDGSNGVVRILEHEAPPAKQR